MSAPAYLLGRSILAATRLNLNHYQWKQVFGYTLHPSVPRNGEATRVADIGTGTGQVAAHATPRYKVLTRRFSIWVCDAQSEFPSSATFEGFDISPAQFTSGKHLPKNVFLRTLDSTTEVREDMRGKYDVVHLRLLQAAISNNDPSPFIAHAKSLLRPGGMLQWGEVDRLARGADVLSMPGLERLSSMAESMRPSSWIGSLPEILLGQGFKVIAVDRSQELQWQRQQMMESAVLVAEEVATQLDTVDPSGQKGGAVREAAKRASDEVRNGAFFSQTFQIVVAQLEEL